MKKTIIVIGAHISDYDSNYLLTNLIQKINHFGSDYGIVSHSKVSGIHFEKAKFYMFDSENDKFHDYQSSEFWYENENFRIESPFLYYGSVPNYSYGAINLFIDAVILAKRYGYKFLHWIEYDKFLPKEEILENEKIFETTNSSCVVYKTESQGHPIHGSFISIDLEKLKTEYFFLNKNFILQKLKELGYSAEKFIHSILLSPLNIFEKKTLENTNNYNQADKKSCQYCFFEKDEKIEFFIKNNTDKNLKYSLKTNLSEYENNLGKFQWNLSGLGKKENLNFVQLKMDEEIFFIDTKNEQELQKYVYCNKFLKKGEL